MKHDRRSWITTMCLVLGGACTLAAGADDTKTDQTPRKPGGPGSAAASDAKALAGQIDRLLAARWAEAKVQPARAADDAEYLRRVYLDLVGKIPTAAEARDFLDDSSGDKRTQLVESLLDSPAYLTHATETFRTLLLPEADTDGQLGAAVGPFEAWLRKKCPTKTATTGSFARCSRFAWVLRGAGEATHTILAPSHRRWPTTSPRMPSPRTSPPAPRHVPGYPARVRPVP